MLLELELDVELEVAVVVVLELDDEALVLLLVFPPGKSQPLSSSADISRISPFLLSIVL